ncbi:MAG: hypothetical protein EA397_01350 [Deltaproteobacteria bacterium]|nr:MAG: hypothetical protein EA397_01350 [Deltaproteobacteria bacterium]
MDLLRALFILHDAVAVLDLTARGLSRGRGRIPQTILAIVNLGSVPIRTAFALWICWKHEQTQAQFKGPAHALH